MKRFIVVVFLLATLYFVLAYRADIVNFVMRNFVDNKTESFGDANEYYKDYDYEFVQNTDSLYPSSRQDILNIIYSTLNRGLSEVTFYCADGYDACISDVNDIANNSSYLSTINNLVHPYNSYHHIHFSISDYGRVRINVDKIYTENDILLINNRLDDISREIIYDGMSDYDKILAFHDYIVNNTSYDTSVTMESQMYNKTDSSNALGVLFNRKAICSGYSDVMSIFLSKNGINNYKISSSEHIWNLVNYDSRWLHLDVTWDDPVSNSGKDILIHDYFLIDTNQLFINQSQSGKSDHSYDTNLYLEAK